MTLQKWGGIAAITEALTYIFGFILFFAVLDSTGYDSPAQRLEFLVLNRDHLLGSIEVFNPGGVIIIIREYGVMLFTVVVFNFFSHKDTCKSFSPFTIEIFSMLKI